jgi:OmpA-OmpF porin, OOP family
MMSFFNRLKLPGKLLFLALLAGAVFGLKWLIWDSGKVIQRVATESVTLTQLDLPTVTTSNRSQTVVPKAAFPGTQPIHSNQPPMRFLIWAWNAQMGLIYANGGAETTEGSLMAANQVNLRLERQDDVPQMAQSLVKFASAYKSDPNTREGAQFIAIMGDGSAAFLAGLNPELEKLGPEYRAQIIGSCGKSLGEDKFMGLPAWKENPQAAKGALVAAVLRDGDWNIVIKWCSDNGIPVNADEKTYDPNAVNFVNASTYIEAAEKYIAGYSEERPVVSKGKRIGTQTVTVNGVATWTPGDVMIAHKKGGLVSIVSTKEYRNQMPNVIIGIKKFCDEHRPEVEGMLTALFQGGDQLKAYPDALQKAGDLSAKVYKEESGAYWVKYYKGTMESDKTGNPVELGGSRVHNLADNLELFGLAEGSANVFGKVYQVFGNVVVQLYPQLVPSYPALDDVLDASFVKAVASRTHKMAPADRPVFNADDNITQKVSAKAWSIEFASGKSVFSPQAQQQLNRLFDDLVIAGDLKVEIHGHTDNTGTPVGNDQLSLDRALAIKKYLESQSSSNFASGRIAVVAHGQHDPVASNNTPEGRAQNRRVEIVLGR